jgi:hypothetical protein
VSEPERPPPRQQYTSGFQPRGLSLNSVSMWRAMLRDTSGAPARFASNAECCL